MIWVIIISLFLILLGMFSFRIRSKKEDDLTSLLNNEIEKNKIQHIIQKSNTQDEAIQKIRANYKLNTIQSIEVIGALQDDIEK